MHVVAFTSASNSQNLNLALLTLNP